MKGKETEEIQYVKHSERVRHYLWGREYLHYAAEVVRKSSW